MCACVCVLAGGLRGATIVDSLDTLYIMGLTEDYKEAKEWICTNLDLDVVRTCLTHKQLFSTHFSTDGNYYMEITTHHMEIIKINMQVIQGGFFW